MALITYPLPKTDGGIVGILSVVVNGGPFVEVILLFHGVLTAHSKNVRKTGSIDQRGGTGGTGAASFAPAARKFIFCFNMATGPPGDRHRRSLIVKFITGVPHNQDPVFDKVWVLPGHQFCNG